LSSDVVYIQQSYLSCPFYTLLLPFWLHLFPPLPITILFSRTTHIHGATVPISDIPPQAHPLLFPSFLPLFSVSCFGHSGSGTLPVARMGVCDLRFHSRSLALSLDVSRPHFTSYILHLTPYTLHFYTSTLLHSYTPFGFRMENPISSPKLSLPLLKASILSKTT